LEGGDEKEIGRKVGRAVGEKALSDSGCLDCMGRLSTAVLK